MEEIKSINIEVKTVDNEFLYFSSGHISIPITGETLKYNGYEYSVADRIWERLDRVVLIVRIKLNPL